VIFLYIFVTYFVLLFVIVCGIYLIIHIGIGRCIKLSSLEFLLFVDMFTSSKVQFITLNYLLPLCINLLSRHQHSTYDA